MKTMLKSMIVLGALAAVACITGCATPLPFGLVYTRVTEPIALGDGNMRYALKGEAECTSICGLFASGDCSLNAACRSAKILKVSWANREITNVLGIYGVYKTVVYGEAGTPADAPAVK